MLTCRQSDRADTARHIRVRQPFALTHKGTQLASTLFENDTGDTHQHGRHGLLCARAKGDKEEYG